MTLNNYYNVLSSIGDPEAASEEAINHETKYYYDDEEEEEEPWDERCSNGRFPACSKNFLHFIGETRIVLAQCGEDPMVTGQAKSGLLPGSRFVPVHSNGNVDCSLSSDDCPEAHCVTSVVGQYAVITWNDRSETICGEMYLDDEDESYVLGEIVEEELLTIYPSVIIRPVRLFRGPKTYVPGGNFLRPEENPMRITHDHVSGTKCDALIQVDLWTLAFPYDHEKRVSPGIDFRLKGTDEFSFVEPDEALILKNLKRDPEHYWKILRKEGEEREEGRDGARRERGNRAGARGYEENKEKKNENDDRGETRRCKIRGKGEKNRRRVPCKDCGGDVEAPGTCEISCKRDFFHDAYRMLGSWGKKEENEDRSRFLPPPCRAGNKCHKKHGIHDPTGTYVSLKMDVNASLPPMGECLVTGLVTGFSRYDTNGDEPRPCPGILSILPVQIKPLPRAMAALTSVGCNVPWDPLESWKKYLWWNGFREGQSLSGRMSFDAKKEDEKQCSFGFVSADRSQNYFY